MNPIIELIRKSNIEEISKKYKRKSKIETEIKILTDVIEYLYSPNNVDHIYITVKWKNYNI